MRYPHSKIPQKTLKSTPYSNPKINLGIQKLLFYTYTNPFFWIADDRKINCIDNSINFDTKSIKFT